MEMPITNAKTHIITFFIVSLLMFFTCSGFVPKQILKFKKTLKRGGGSIVFDLYLVESFGCTMILLKKIQGGLSAMAE
jgi:hypothetical protein